MSSTVRLLFFGHPEILQYGKPLYPRLPKKGLAALSFLALTPQPVGRETVATLLWPDASASASSSSLRSLLSNLRKQLPGLLEATQGTISLNCQQASVDVLDFQSGIGKIQAVQHRSNFIELTTSELEQWEATLALYRSDFLDGLHVGKSPPAEQWITQQREYLRLEVLTNLEGLANAYVAKNEINKGLKWISRLLALEPFSEAAYRKQIAWLAAIGRRSEALQSYATCCKMLEREFDATPSPELIALHEDILADKVPSLLRDQLVDVVPVKEIVVTDHTEHIGPVSSTDARFKNDERLSNHSPPPSSAPPPPLTSSTVPTNLKYPLQTTIGRRAVLDYAMQTIMGPTNRLLTIIGSGGMGKTTLAREIGRHLLAMQDMPFPDGLFFIRLAGISSSVRLTQDMQGNTLSSSALISAIANQIGFHLEAGLSAQIQLQNYLAKRQLLLILDNFEHLHVESNTVLELLTTCPFLKMIVTSRIRLNVRGETLLPLDKLSLPSTSGADDNLDLCQESEAVAMFVQRAQCLLPDFAITQENQGDVIQVCRLIDGLPLGIELATSMLPMLNCRELASEIACGLDFLEADISDIPQEQRTLRAVFERSWQLLPPQEQTLLARLAIFPSTFHRDAAKVIANASISALARLHNQSLLSIVEEGRRYAIHCSIREFALEKLRLSQVEFTQVGMGHARFYLNFMLQQLPAIVGADQVASAMKIHRELSNVRLAWQWAIVNGLYPELNGAMHTLYIFYEQQGLYADGKDDFGNCLQALLSTDSADNSEMTLLTGRLYTYLGLCNVRLVQVEEAEATLRAGWKRLQGQKNLPARVLCLTSLASVLRGSNLEESKAFMAVAMTLEAEISEETTRALIYLTQAEISFLCGAYDESLTQCTVGLDLANQVNWAWGIASGYRTMGRASLSVGRVQEAEGYFRAGINNSHKNNLKFFHIEATIDLGKALRRQGHIDEAKASYAASRWLIQEREYKELLSLVLWEEGCLAEQCQNYSAAEALFAKSLETERHPNHWGHILPTLGWALIGLGELSEAQTYFQQVLDEAQAKQAIPISLDALAGLLSLRGIRAKRAAHPQPKESLQIAFGLQVIQRHSAITQETGERIARAVAELNLGGDDSSQYHPINGLSTPYLQRGTTRDIEISIY